MRILANTTVQTTVNDVNLTSLNNQVSGKADTSDLPVGSEDQVSVGKLVSIDINPAAGTILLAFEGAEYTITDLIIS